MRTFLLVIFAVYFSFSRNPYSNLNAQIPHFSSDTLNKAELNAEVSFRKSDTAFSYYKIVLTNLTDSIIEIPYAEGCFDPGSKNGNELGCGIIFDKYYSAVLYNIDHLEISKYMRIKPRGKIIFYVKWSTKNAAYKKSLIIKYYSNNGESNMSVDFPE